MPKYRNIRVKMKGGKTRIQRAMVLASGKLRFVKGKARAKASHKKKSGRKKGYVFTKARRAALAKTQRASRRKGKSRPHKKARRRGGSRGGIRLG